jgi:phosphatidylinositol N-acetylglucosaminyltransferase subunit H
MPCHRPLAETHPELLVNEHQGFTEFRVENRHLARDGSGVIIKGCFGFTWLDAIFMTFFALISLSVGSLC